MLFVASLFGRMGGKHQLLFQRSQVSAIFIQEVEGCRDRMCLIEVVYIWLESQLIHQFGTTNA